MESTSFFKRLSENGIIDEPDLSIATRKTATLLQKADALWDNAITTGRLGNKVYELNGEYVIKREIISEAWVAETVNGVLVERPVIDLVQQGGGMFGIALVGYTYIMEKAGIRFYSLGGTSAGGINALLLGALPNTIYKTESSVNKDRQGTKSEAVAHIIANTNFSKFMDRKGLVGKIQGRLIRNFKLSSFILALGLLCLAFAFVLYWLVGSIFNFSGIGFHTLRFYDFIIGPLAAASPFIILYLLFIRILGRNFGINSGDAFYNWIKDILNDPLIGINKTSELQSRVAETRFNSQKITKEFARVLFITSNLTHNRIVKFPERAQDYWGTASHNVNPAAYIRATMSIPFIFETFIPGTEHVEGQVITNINKARFVDGGMLSNFPIREFDNHSIDQPRFPTFGVLLSERSMEITTPQDKSEQEKKFLKSNLGGYIISFLSTFRNFYDNDFLLSKPEISQRVQLVDTKSFNWLDFWMNDDKKNALFEKGAEAAIAQLAKFEFKEYLKARKNA